ncbi:MAG: VCBS repeat-containing protein [FCB group bacterium]|nr:VCBS repeat-containing protein [FCB group bacterium]MBL7027141.1 VCBS repeat-containing protein [Candidatus Neomarinimicrobiota bacterium]MBL7120624.1 VCBS repeat-containing protein [Candidatus Neomarinimicrobiota bacterium]
MMKSKGVFLVLCLCCLISTDGFAMVDDIKEMQMDFSAGRQTILRDGSLRDGINVYPIIADTLNQPPTTPGWQTRGIKAGSDLDNDGLKEIIITDYNVHGVHVYEVIGDNTLEWVATLNSDSTTYFATPRSVVTGDLDGNGRGEIIYLGMRDPNELHNGINVWEWDGVVGSDNYNRYILHPQIDGVFLDRYYGNNPLHVGDVDDDGQQELLIANNGSDHAFDVCMITSVAGTFETGFFDLVTEYYVDQNQGYFNGSPGYGEPNIGDLDGDGSNEAIFFAWDHSTALIFEATGVDAYEMQLSIQLDSSLTDQTVYGATHVTDVDGDGHDEVYTGSYSQGWFMSVTAGNDVADISYENGDIKVYPDTSAFWDVTGGDIDGDNQDEMFSIDYNNGRITQWDYDGTNWQPLTLIEWPNVMGGFSLDFAGDLDGDGFPELIQGFLEPPFSEGNPEGYIFAVIEFTDSTLQQVDFRVNMNIQESLGVFDPEVDHVELRGSFNGWVGESAPLSEVNNSGIYRIGVDFSQYEANSNHEYKFVIVKPDEDIWEFLGQNRSLTYLGHSMTLPTVYFDDYNPGETPIYPWAVNIFLESGDYHDVENIFGMLYEATDGYDQDIDIPEPPLPPSDYIQLYFLHEEWGVPVGPRFSTDYRSVVSLSNRTLFWDFEVATDLIDNQVFLYFSELYDFPSVHTYYLEDLTAGVFQNLNQNQIYQFNTGSAGIRQFRIAIGQSWSNQLTRVFEPGWHLFSLPLESDDHNVWDLFEPYATDSYYVYSYEPTNGYQPESELYRGEGYWLASMADLEVQIEGPVDTNMFAIPLELGWNLIGHPFATDRWLSSLSLERNGETLDFDSAVNNGWISNALYGYQNESYYQENILHPWSGYWISALDHGLTLLVDGAESTQLTTVRDCRSEEEWYMSIFAHRDSHADMMTEIGVHPEATSGFDSALDSPEPPLPPAQSYVSTYFVHSDWNEYIGPRFNRDIRSPILMDDQNVWQMTIKSDPGEVVLTWDYDAGEFPDQMQFLLTDVRDGITVDMLTTESYLLENNHGESLFLITALRSTLDISSQALPESYSLEQNYPNPFNPTTTIKYGLPETSKSQLSIFNLAGKKVITLVNEEQSAGWYEYSWNGIDQAGEPVATGLYFARIESGGFSRVVKMLFLK